MKKIATIFFSIIFVTLMAGCTSDYMEERLVILEEETQALETTKIELTDSNDLLTTERDDLTISKDLLEDQISKVTVERDSLTVLKSTLESQIIQLGIELENAKSDNQIALETKIAALESDLDEVTLQLESSFDGAFILKINNELSVFNYKSEDNLTLFDHIEASDLIFEYSNSSFGHMVNTVGSITEDMFHWVSLFINDEGSMVGIDDLEFHNGDIIEFKQLPITWDTTFTATYNGDGGFNNLQFTTTTGELFYIDEDNLPEGMTINAFIVGSDYQITGMSEVAAVGYGCSNCIIPTTIIADYITDFTQLYTLEAGSTLFLQFTVTELSDGWVWGTEVKASDSNGVLSADVTQNLLNPFSSGYLFYTFPEDIELEVGSTYVAKLGFDLFPPNSKAQLGFVGIDIDGNIDYENVEIYLLDDEGNIVKSAVATEEPNEKQVCTGFSDIRDNLNAQEQCEVSFTVSTITLGTPQAIDKLDIPSTDIMGYFFDSSWSDVVEGKSYTVTIEKQINGQIKLIGSLLETPQVKSFLDIRDTMDTGDQCDVTFTVTSVSWGTPQATDSFNNPSTDVLAYFFDSTWGSAENGKTYTTTIEKLSNGQITLIGELTEVTNE